MPTYERFQVALQGIDGAQWRIFERLANVFMLEEYSSFRPLAAPSGDLGLDGNLFIPADDEGVAVQFSVRKDWAAKVRDTCKRFKATYPEASLFIYATSQAVGPDQIALKREIRNDYGIFLDIRDREWFLTRRDHSAATQAESELFCEQIADPLLQDPTAIERQGQALDDLEAKAAFVYLGLQWQDDTREKGLTKVCFEAIVRAVLRATTSDDRMTREQVRSQVRSLLPAHHVPTLDTQVDGALNRLSKVHIRHWKKDDEFCLTWDERVRLNERLAWMESLDADLRAELSAIINRVGEESDLHLVAEDVELSVERARTVLERVLLNRGEVFAEAITKERGAGISFGDVEALVYDDLASKPASKGVEPRIVAAAIIGLMADPPETVKVYLRSLADTYTLFAFMRETPDVQSAVVKIFSDGEIWLDTSVVLPLFAEDLLEEGSRAHGLMLRAAREAGLRLFVTEGVLQELATHIYRCKGYYHAMFRGDTYGTEPFLLSSFRLSGRPLEEFEGWLETFCGQNRAEDDIADFLHEMYGIADQSLTELVANADPQLTAIVGEIWHEARDARDERAREIGAPVMDANTRALLVSHDVENYVGVQMRREARRERKSAYGYRSWWLTLDGTAFRVHHELKDRIEGRPPASPAISPDFMLHYLAVGPVRARLSRKTEETLPLMLNMSILDAVPQDLIDLSDVLRKQLSGMAPHVVRRKIRDTLDEARLLLGAQARAGSAGLTDEIKQRLISQATRR